GEPVVYVADDRVFAQVDVQRVLDVVGQGVFSGEAAAVVRCGIGPVALHPPTADAAPQAAPQRVGVLGAVRLVLSVLVRAPGDHDLYLLEDVAVDNGRVDDLL